MHDEIRTQEEIDSEKPTTNKKKKNPMRKKVHHLSFNSTHIFLDDFS